MYITSCMYTLAHQHVCDTAYCYAVYTLRFFLRYIPFLLRYVMHLLYLFLLSQQQIGNTDYNYLNPYFSNFLTFYIHRVLHIIQFQTYTCLPFTSYIHYELHFTGFPALGHYTDTSHHIDRFLFSSCSPPLQACSTASKYPCNVHPTALSSEVGRASLQSI